MATWRKDYDPDPLAQSIAASKTTSAGTGVTYSGFEHSGRLVVLGGMLELNEEIPDVERHRILNTATFNAGAAEVVTPDSLRRHESKLESEYLRKPFADFRLSLLQRSAPTVPHAVTQSIGGRGRTVSPPVLIYHRLTSIDGACINENRGLFARAGE